MQAHEINQQDVYEPMRTDLDESLAKSHIELSTLSPFQRILLTTDGTLTKILEAYLFEPIQIVKLSEGIVSITKDLLPLNLNIGNQIIERKILLQGKISQRNLIYAESILALERLDKNFKDELLKSKIPMGKLWLEYKIETFKEIIDSSKESAENLSNYFKIAKEDKMLSRTYRVFSNRQPIIMITEKIPASYFLKDF